MMTYRDVTVGVFLVSRYIRGANPWTTILVTFVTTLTFLNFTVIGGLLEGIIVGSFVGLRDRAIGDVVISPKDGETRVNRTQHIIRALERDGRVASFSPRRRAQAEVIASRDIYRVTDGNERRKSITTTLLGVDPDAEKATTRLPDSILEGDYFTPGGSRKDVLVGSALLERYSPFGEQVLSDVHPGDYLYIRRAGSRTDEHLVDARSRLVSGAESASSGATLQKYLVRGVYRTKAGEMDLAVIAHEDAIRLREENPGNDVGTIAVRLVDSGSASAVRDSLLAEGFGKYAKIQTTQDAIGSFLDDVRSVFDLLGSVIGAIGLAVSSVTIFIIIFVTASSRSRFIGVLKAVGITAGAIRLSYILYALSFAVAGIALGLAILLLILVPFFEANPIPFPFSDGILHITPMSVAVKIALLLAATAVAGLIPAHRVTRKPAIESLRER